MSDICKCFAPVENAGCTILILGSMPGERSLELQQYYGHKNNRFWRLMAEIFNNGEMLDDYEERKALLLRSNVALWDVLAFCRREGSLDSAIRDEEYNDLAGFIASAIRDEEYNDLAGFIARHPKIRRICCNGGKAYAALKKYCRTNSLNGVEILAMPSTSPANARCNFEKLKNIWAPALLN